MVNMYKVDVTVDRCFFFHLALRGILWRLLAQITTNYYSVQLFLSLLCFYLIVANVNVSVKGDKC